MQYTFEDLKPGPLFGLAIDATAALTRLDERLAVSPLGPGWVARSHFGDACSSLWIDGELVHLEDLVLHDAGMSVRAPTHELGQARDVLRTRRRILSHPADWALSPQGLMQLRRNEDSGLAAPETKSWSGDLAGRPPADEVEDALDRELAAMDAILSRSEALLRSARDLKTPPPSDRSDLLHDADWDEDERLFEWRKVLTGSEGLPPVLRAALLVDAWNMLQVLQHAPWLGRLLAMALLRETGVTTSHLVCLNLGLKALPREQRTSRDRNVRLSAVLRAMSEAAQLGMKEHDRLLLARSQMEHRLAGRRASSKLPQLIELILSSPIVSTGMIAKALDVTPQGALKIAAELNLRELTGRGRFRAWGVI